MPERGLVTQSGKSYNYLENIIFQDGDILITKNEFPSKDAIVLFLIEYLEECMEEVNSHSQQNIMFVLKTWFRLFDRSDLQEYDVQYMYQLYDDFIVGNEFPKLSLELAGSFVTGITKIKNQAIEYNFGQSGRIFSYKKITETIRERIEDIKRGQIIDKIQDTSFSLDGNIGMVIKSSTEIWIKFILSENSRPYKPYDDLENLMPLNSW
jgi:hypothetical protein